MFNLKNFLNPVNILRKGGKKRGKTKRKMLKKGGWQIKSKTRTRRARRARN